MSDSVQPQQPIRLLCPWDSPGKNTGVGCRFLLQCMKVKSESEVAQSCLTLSDPMDCSLPGSSVHGIFQARVLEWGAIFLLYLPSKLLISLLSASIQMSFDEVSEKKLQKRRNLRDQNNKKKFQSDKMIPDSSPGLKGSHQVLI